MNQQQEKDTIAVNHILEKKPVRVMFAFGVVRVYDSVSEYCNVSKPYPANSRDVMDRLELLEKQGRVRIHKVPGEVRIDKVPSGVRVHEVPSRVWNIY